MANTQTSLSERLLVKLKELGLTDRKAKELAKGIAPTAARQKVTGTVTGKLTEKLLKLGIRESKAKELAKGLAPIVRASIKAKAKKEATPLIEVDDETVNKAVSKVLDEHEDPDLDKVAPRVNGHRVRLDLPVVPMPGIKGIELLRVMDGLTSTATYLVAAVRKDEGILAVRKLGVDYFNVKFYPDMAYWNRDELLLIELGAHSHLKRQWYERMHFSLDSLNLLLEQVNGESKPKIQQLLKRYLAVGTRPLLKAFEFLSQKVSQVA